jgi:hypothetical protein
VQVIEQKEGVSREIKDKVESIRDIWKNSSGKFSNMSKEVDDLLIAKRNVERVISTIQDYLNIDLEVADLRERLEDDEEIFGVYKKLKIMTFVKMTLIKRVEDQGSDDLNMNKLRKIKD